MSAVIVKRDDRGIIVQVIGPIDTYATACRQATAMLFRGDNLTNGKAKFDYTPSDLTPFKDAKA